MARGGGKNGQSHQCRSAPQFTTGWAETGLERRRNASEDHDGEPTIPRLSFRRFAGLKHGSKAAKGCIGFCTPKTADKAELTRWTQKGIEVAPAYRLENAPVLVAAFDSHKGNGSRLCG